MSREEEDSKEVYYSWSGGVQNLGVLDVKALCKRCGSEW